MKKDKIKEIQELIESGSLTPQMSRETVLYGNKIEMTSKSDGSYIYEALNKKTFVKQEGSEDVVAFTDDCLVEISDKTINEIVDTFEKYTKHLIETIKARGVGVDKITELLGLYESAYSNYLVTPKYERLRKEVVSFIKDLYESGDSETKRRILKGSERFFLESKKDIPRGYLTFPNIKVRVRKDGSKVRDEAPSKWKVKIEEEKESLRNEFIFKAFDDGLWDYAFLYENGIISGLGGYDVNSFVRESVRLTPEEKVNCFIVSGVMDSREDVLEYYLKNNKRFFVEIANIDEIVDSFVNGKVSLKDISKRLRIQEIKELSPERLESLLSVQGLPKNLDFLNFVQDKKANRQERFISKKLFSVLDRNQIMKLSLSDKLEYKNPLESEAYIDMFGKLKLEDIKALEENELINPEDIIKLMKFSSLEEINLNEYREILDYIRNYYSYEKLNFLRSEGKINKSFVSMFNNFLVNLGEQKRNEYTDSIYNEMLNADNYEEELLGYLKDGFDLPFRDDMVISNDVLTEMYLEDKIDESFIVSLYQKGFVKPDILRELFSSEDILDAYRNGDLDSAVLNFIQNRQEVIREELERGSITLEDIITLYSDKEGIGIEELKYILEHETLESVDLAEFIPDDIDETKIEGLFENYFISHDDLSNLVSRGIISSEEADIYASKMNTHEIFESIFNNVADAILVRDTETGESRTPGLRVGTNKRAGQIKNDPELIDMLLDEIGFDKRELLLRGENNSLDGYRVRVSDKYGVMALYNFDKPGNATYITSLQQGLFFLNRLVRKRRVDSMEGVEEKVDSVESTATKQELRETEHVKIRNASRWLGRNIVDSMKKISDKFARDYRKEKDYKDKIDVVITTIRDDYDERKR